MAGLIAYYDTANHYYLHISQDEDLGRELNIIKTVAGPSEEILEKGVPLPADGTVHLRVTIHTSELQFSWSLDGASWQDIGPVLESKVLSDDFHELRFTGAFIGLCAQDLVQGCKPADFKCFRYEEV
jgi:xylan 1,4-beta-xylosidase